MKRRIRIAAVVAISILAIGGPYSAKASAAPVETGPQGVLSGICIHSPTGTDICIF